MKKKNNKRIILFITFLLYFQQATAFAWIPDWKASIQNIPTSLKSIAATTKEHLFSLPTTQKIVYGGLFALGVITLPALYIWQPWQKKPLLRKSLEKKQSLRQSFDNPSVYDLLYMVFQRMNINNNKKFLIKLTMNGRTANMEIFEKEITTSDTEFQPLFKEAWIDNVTNKDVDRVTGYAEHPSTFLTGKNIKKDLIELKLENVSLPYEK